jgi:uncharacterized membrane protein YkvA (DUF1232 family)
MSGVKSVLKQGASIGIKTAPGMGTIERLKALIRAPSVARLVWTLFQDPRVPAWQKGTVLSALAIVVSPLDVVELVPVLGELGDIVFALFILDAFIKFAPAAVVNEHIMRLRLQKRIPLRSE